MPIIIKEYEQRSAEWYAVRLGNPGASNISKIITSKGEISKQREEYLYQLAGEKITGKAEEGFISQAMLNGMEREDAARSLFSMIHNVEVDQCAIVFKDEYRLFHCSPDGLSPDATLEMKNPMLKTHVKYLLEGKLPVEYFGQCQMSAYVCERAVCYFMSNYEGLPPLIIPVHRDESYIKKLAVALDDFCADLARIVEKLRSMQ